LIAESIQGVFKAVKKATDAGGYLIFQQQEDS